jgi:hypothetical protein
MFNFLRRKPRWNKDIKAIPQPAFKLGGVQYYSFPSFLDHSPIRAEWISVFSEELNMRCTKEFLLTHLKAVEQALNSNPIKITSIANWNKQLKDRLEYISDPETIYNMASVIFFDENEDPSQYDQEYNKKKIALWKKHKMRDFFLEVPWNKLIPGLDSLPVDLDSFIRANQAVSKITTLTLEDILQELSKSGLTEELKKDLQSQIQCLKELETLHE